MKQIDRIRNMNAEKLARCFNAISQRPDQKCCICIYSLNDVICVGNNKCKKGIKAWLESEVEE